MCVVYVRTYEYIQSFSLAFEHRVFACGDAWLYFVTKSFTDKYGTKGHTLTVRERVALGHSSLVPRPSHMLHAEKSGRPGRLCDVMMTCGHCLGRGFEISAHSPTHQLALALC